MSSPSCSDASSSSEYEEDDPRRESVLYTLPHRQRSSFKPKLIKSNLVSMNVSDSDTSDNVPAVPADDDNDVPADDDNDVHDWQSSPEDAWPKNRKESSPEIWAKNASSSSVSVEDEDLGWLTQKQNVPGIWAKNASSSSVSVEDEDLGWLTQKENVPGKESREIGESSGGESSRHESDANDSPVVYNPPPSCKRSVLERKKFTFKKPAKARRRSLGGCEESDY